MGMTSSAACSGGKCLWPDAIGGWYDSTRWRRVVAGRAHDERKKRGPGPLSAGTNGQACTGAVLCHVPPKGFRDAVQLSSPSGGRHREEDATSPRLTVLDGGNGPWRRGRANTICHPSHKYPTPRPVVWDDGVSVIVYIIGILTLVGEGVWHKRSSWAAQQRSGVYGTRLSCTTSLPSRYISLKNAASPLNSAE